MTDFSLPGTEPPLVSVVVPVFDEEQVLPQFHARLAATMQEAGVRWEAIYVNDGSTDATLRTLELLRAGAGNVAIVNLSRNFGKEIALTAGLDRARGDAVVVIDADLQDPPEVILELLRVWREGADIVYAQRRRRDGETWLKRTTAALFYRLMERTGRVKLPRDTGDFRLMSRRVVTALVQLREQHRFMKGLFAWVGFRSTAVLYDRAPRQAGTTKWNYWKLWNFALEGITSFTVMPLKIATYFGLVVALLAVCYGSFIIVLTLRYGNPVAGYPSLLVVVLFLGGVQLMTLGIIGEYLGRVFNETKNRPLYIVDSSIPAGADPPGISAAAADPPPVRDPPGPSLDAPPAATAAPSVRPR